MTTQQRAPQQQQPLFGTVLVARSPQETPSGLELQMRHYSTRLRVVEKLSGGAHLLLPGSERTIAVRAYYDKTLVSASNDENKEPNETTRRVQQWHDLNHPDSWEDLVAFRKAFKYPFVFFVLPAGPVQEEQLSNPHSFLQRAQRIMKAVSGGTSESSPRVFVVPDVASAIQILSSLLDVLQPQKQDMKGKYFAQVQSRLFLTNSPPEVASIHVVDTLREWASRMRLAEGEENVLMSLMESLSAIANADKNTFENVPVEEETQQIMQAFFGTRPATCAATESVATEDTIELETPAAQQMRQGVVTMPMSRHQQTMTTTPYAPPPMMTMQPPPSVYHQPPPYYSRAPPASRYGESFRPPVQQQQQPYSRHGGDPYYPPGVMANPQLLCEAYTPRYPCERAPPPPSSFGTMATYAQPMMRPPPSYGMHHHQQRRAPMGKPIRAFSPSAPDGQFSNDYFN